MRVTGKDLLEVLLSGVELTDIDLWHLLMKSTGFDFVIINDLHEDLDVRVVPGEYCKEVYNVKTGETVDDRGNLYESLMKLAVNIIPNMEDRGKWETSPEEYERLEKELENKEDNGSC